MQSMQRQLVGVSDDQWGARGVALPNVESPNTVKRVSWWVARRLLVHGDTGATKSSSSQHCSS